MKQSLIFVLLSLFNVANAGELAPFKSDGCRAFPDGTLVQNKLWLKCCVEHDKAYWKGGTYQQRKSADNALKMCVADVGQPEIAQLMLAGVRVGGTPYFPTAFRWGYGWPYLKYYNALSEEEKNQVEILYVASNEHANDQVASQGDELISTIVAGSAEHPDPVLEKVLQLEQQGVLRDVIIMESFPVQIKLTGPKDVIVRLQAMPRKSSAEQ